jgi:hypothetical protein
MRIGFVSLLVGAMAMLLVTPGQGAAQPLTLVIQNGALSVTARNASVREILDRWAQATGGEIVNSEQVPSTPVTLTLEAVTEREAFAILLLDVTGYILAMRPERHAETGSLVSRIVVASSTAPQCVGVGTNGTSCSFQPPPSPELVKPAPVLEPIPTAATSSDDPERLPGVGPSGPLPSEMPAEMPVAGAGRVAAPFGASHPGVIAPVPEVPAENGSPSKRTPATSPNAASGGGTSPNNE